MSISSGHDASKGLFPSRLGSPFLLQNFSVSAEMLSCQSIILFSIFEITLG